MQGATVGSSTPQIITAKKAVFLFYISPEIVLPSSGHKTYLSLLLNPEGF